MQHYNEINFEVPLSGSKLFDMTTKSTARGLCARFPGLEYEIDEQNRVIRIFGKLNDNWYDKFRQAVFEIGEDYWKE